MASQENDENSGFQDLLSDLGDSDVVIEVVAANGRKTPSAGAMERLEEAVVASYRALAGGTRVELETVAVLDEVSKRSLSLWLRVKSKGEAADPSQLKFLARGMLAIIAWMDGSSTHQLADLQQAIRVLAWGTAITSAAQPVLPASSELVNAIVAWQQAKDVVGTGNAVRVISNNGSVELDLSKSVADPRGLLQARKLINHSADMIFVVEMPDYQATGQWQLKHGGTRTLAYCEPGTLLDKFYRRELDVRPGDALRCRVDFETSYGPDHEVLSERYRIVEIIEVLPASRGETAPAQQRPEPEAVRQTAEELEPAS